MGTCAVAKSIEQAGLGFSLTLIANVPKLSQSARKCDY